MVELIIRLPPRDIWKKLWKIKLPHRGLLFIWKCLKEIVPTRLKFSHYNREIDISYGISNHPEESLFHLLITCNHARVAWSLLNINIQQVAVACTSIRECIISWFTISENITILNIKTG